MHAYMPDWQERERRLRKQAATARGERRENWNPNLGDAVTMQEKVDAGLSSSASSYKKPGRSNCEKTDH